MTTVPVSPAFRSWMVRGCLAWQNESLNPPIQVRQATAAYRAEMDTLGHFLADCCITAPHARVGATPLYAAYREWCMQAGERSLSRVALKAALAEQEYPARRSGKDGAVEYHGLGLREEPARG